MPYPPTSLLLVGAAQSLVQCKITIVHCVESVDPMSDSDEHEFW
jgi:hypothetical protein